MGETNITVGKATINAKPQDFSQMKIILLTIPSVIRRVLSIEQYSVS